MTLLAVKNLIMTSPDLDTIKKKMDQAPKQKRKEEKQETTSRTR